MVEYRPVKAIVAGSSPASGASIDFQYAQLIILLAK